MLAEALRGGLAVRFRAEGRSMRPFIQAGDIAVVAPAPPVAALRRGDVLLYERAPGALRLHRLQRILPGGILRAAAPAAASAPRGGVRTPPLRDPRRGGGRAAPRLSW